MNKLYFIISLYFLNKKIKIMEILSMGKKVNDYFSKFYFVKLDELGDDHESYGNMVLNGSSHAPLQINIDYIMKRAKKKEFDKIREKSPKIEKIIIDDNYSEFDLKNKNKKLIKNFKYSEFNLPLIKSKNKNKSMENLHCYDFEEQNIENILNKNNKSNIFPEEMKRSDTFITIKNINFKSKIMNKKIRENKNKRYRNKEDLNSLPKLKNKIFISNRNFKSFIQTDMSEIKTEVNKRNHILKRNAFLRRYDKKESINKRLTSLNDSLLKINKNITKIIRKSDEDIPQFELRFNNLKNKLFYNK